MRWGYVSWAAEEADVSLFGASFGFHFVLDGITSAMQPALALHALNNKVALLISLLAGDARTVRSAWATLGVTLLPGAVETWVVGAARLTLSAPLTLPISMRHIFQRWIHTVDVVADVAVVAQNQTCLVVSFSATCVRHEIVICRAYQEIRMV